MVIMYYGKRVGKLFLIGAVFFCKGNKLYCTIAKMYIILLNFMKRVRKKKRDYINCNLDTKPTTIIISAEISKDQNPSR